MMPRGNRSKPKHRWRAQPEPETYSPEDLKRLRCRILMQDGKWRVPKAERPKLNRQDRF